MKPQSHKNDTLSIVSDVLTILALLSFSVCWLNPKLIDILFTSPRMVDLKTSTACLSNLKQLGYAMGVYLEDYDQRFPDATRWGDAITPYVKDKACFRCPVMRRGQFGYAMNAALSGQVRDALLQPGKTPLLYDSMNLSWNAHDTVSSMPHPPRHRSRGNVVAYADGHAKAIPPGKKP